MFATVIGRLSVIAAVVWLGTAYAEEQRADDLVVVSAAPKLDGAGVSARTRLYADCFSLPAGAFPTTTKYVVISSESCTGTNGALNYYKVAVAGEIYFVSRSDLSLSRQDEAKLIALAQDPSSLDRAIAASERIAAEAKKEVEDAAAREVEKAAAAAEAERQAAELAQKRVVEAAEAAKKARVDAYKKELLSKAKYGLAIYSADIRENEYVDATSFEIAVVNPTKKAIKYLTFSVTGYNAVGDPVTDRLKGKTKLQVKGIGPIDPFSPASYEWKFMWHSKIVDSFKIDEIRVEYMDKSVKVVKERDWKSLVLNPEIVAGLREE